jgi:hypothetical protein
MKVGRAVAIEMAVVTAAAAITLFAWLTANASDGSAARGAAWVASHPLGLMARAEQGRVIVSWNREAEAIRRAGRAKLTIIDAGRHDEVTLEAELLRTRDLAYSPLSRSVAFQLTVEGETPRAALTESVLVLTPRR